LRLSAFARDIPIFCAHGLFRFIYREEHEDHEEKRNLINFPNAFVCTAIINKTGDA
jgi:hypothetical protein